MNDIERGVEDMTRERRLQDVIKKSLFCNTKSEPLDFGGVACSDTLKNKGDFYIGFIAALAGIYPKAVLSQCKGDK
ncbi:hypothetical protein I9Y33_002684 [Clostridium perfringens]|nr:hypothetical protein [Clostridium perfringens]